MDTAARITPVITEKKMKLTEFRALTVVAIILAAAFSRVVPHLSNFSPLNAIALFGAAYLTRRSLALVVPLAATWLSDLFLNNVTYAQPGHDFVWAYPGFYWQYLAYAAITLLGFTFFRNGVTLWRTVCAALGAGAVFFVVSNFGVWASGSLYPLTLHGLVACYAAAVPFYQGTLMGDAVFVALLFGGFHLAQRQLAVIAPARLSA